MSQSRLEIMPTSNATSWSPSCQTKEYAPSTTTTSGRNPKGNRLSHDLSKMLRGSSTEFGRLALAPTSLTGGLPSAPTSADCAVAKDSGVNDTDDIPKADSAFPERCLPSSMNIETAGITPENEHDVTNGLSEMSLVSPPFTPSQSIIDLASRGVGTQSPSDGVGSNTAPSMRVRAQLEDLPEVFCESRARIPTTTGAEIFLHVYRNSVDNKEHLAIVFGADILSKTLFEPREGETEYDRMTRGAYIGKLFPGRVSSSSSQAPGGSSTDKSAETNSDKFSPESGSDTLVRIHSECYTGETAWSARCDCGEQLDEAARLMTLEGRGVIVYLRQEGRGIGLGEKLKAYNLQDLGADTVTANLLLRHPADARSFGIATAILQDLGQTRIKLLTNNPDKIVAVEGRNGEVKVTERVPMVPLSWQNKGGFKSVEVDKYLETKIERMGHLLTRQ